MRQLGQKLLKLLQHHLKLGETVPAEGGEGSQGEAAVPYWQADDLLVCGQQSEGEAVNEAYGMRIFDVGDLSLEVAGLEHSVELEGGDIFDKEGIDAVAQIKGQRIAGIVQKELLQVKIFLTGKGGILMHQRIEAVLGEGIGEESPAVLLLVMRIVLQIVVSKDRQAEIILAGGDFLEDGHGMGFL